MFTGIIECTGKVAAIQPRGDAITMIVEAEGFFEGSAPGDSIANDGVCLTIESSTPNSAVFCLMRQTLANTTFAAAKAGALVNLEKASRADSFLGGHFVMGHVDAVGQVTAVAPRQTGVEVDLEIPAGLMRYVIRRGSIALNGISLTVAEKLPQGVRVCIIPETLDRTNLGLWVPGTRVNVEVDMLGKYLENYLSETLREALGELAPDAAEGASVADLLRKVLRG